MLPTRIRDKKMRKGVFNYLILAVFAISAAFMSCDKNPDDPGENGNGNGGEEDISGVYVAGGSNGIWKNGVRQNLTGNTQYASSSSVFVSNNNVYVAGTDYGKAILWKNGVIQNLTIGSGNSYANSVFASGNNVYVVGLDNGQAVLWKNGEIQNLTNGVTSSSAYSVFVSNNDVYVAGQIKQQTQQPDRAVLWKNGVAQFLSGEGSQALSVYVADEDVYVAGYTLVRMSGVWGYYRYVTVWKNGVPQFLAEGGQNTSTKAHSVFVSGNDVYVVGSIDNSAALWKNGVKQNLTGSAAYSVFVSSNDVYVAGTDNKQAVLWKNGVKQILIDGDKANANSVFVVE